MKKQRLIIRSIILSVLFIAIAYALYANITKDARGEVAVGKKAPDFVLFDLEGNRHQLSDYKGKGVFLNFWGTWCKPCEREMPYMNNQYKEYKDQGVEILAVNVGEPEFVINKFVKRHDLVFPILLDDNGRVLTQYNIKPLPTTLLINPEGKITEIVEGGLSEAKIKAMMESIKPK